MPLTRTLRRRLGGLLLTLLASGAAHAADIFLVASYHATDACGKPQYDAAIEALKQGGFGDLTFKGYFLDTRLRPKDEVAQMVENIKRDIRETRPRFVFTIDDAAFAMLYQEVLQYPEIKLVFTGLNRQLDFYDAKADFLDQRRPAANITGVFEYLFMREQFELLEAILERPLNKVAIFHSTDTIGGILRDQILDELANTPYAEQVVVYAAEDVPDMIEKAQQINADAEIDAYIPVTMSLYDPAEDKRKTMKDLAPILTRHISKVDLALNDSFAAYGFFGGVSIDFYQMGFQSGFLATKLLKGGDITQMDIEDARRSIVAINRTRLRELGMTISPDLQSVVDKWID